jgi:hypothetical protein
VSVFQITFLLQDRMLTYIGNIPFRTSVYSVGYVTMPPQNGMS